MRINEIPNEIADAVPFSRDHGHAAYDADYAQRFWRVLLQASRVLAQFRTGFLGKSSPVHFFWGSFDLAVTRFSGRHGAAAPRRRSQPARCGGARSLFARGEQRGVLAGRRRHRLSGLLFLCLSGAAGLSHYAGRSRRGVLLQELGEFILPYDAVRTAADPERR